MKNQVLQFATRYQRAILYLAIAEVATLIVLDVFRVVAGPGVRLVLLTF